MSTGPQSSTPSLRVQSAWLLSAKLLGFGFAFVLPLIVVRVLTQEQFGVYRQSFLVIRNAVAILPIGFAMSAYYYLARDPARRGAAIVNILSVYFVVGAAACAFLAAFPGALGAIFNSAEMTRLAPVIGVTIWLWMFSVFLETVAVANREPRIATAFIVFAQFSKTVLLSGFVIALQTVDAILYAAIVQASIQALILLAYLARRFPRYWLSFDTAFFREHLAYALPFGLAGILWTAQVDIHFYFVSYRFGEAALAVYAVGCFQLPLITMLSESVTSVLIPRMSELQAADDRREMVRLTARAVQKLAFFYLPLYVFLYVTGETLITTLFTNEYRESVPVFRVFLTLLPFSILIADPVVRAYEDLGAFLLRVRIVMFLVLIVGLIAGVRSFGLVGIIAIVISIRAFERLVVAYKICRRIGVTAADAARFRAVGVTAVVAAIAGAVTALTHGAIADPLAATVRNAAVGFLPGIAAPAADFAAGTAVLATSGFVFSALYVAGAWATGLIEEDERAMLRRAGALLRPRRRR